MDIKLLRTDIDKFINSIPMLEPSAEIVLCKRELQRSFSWLGIGLKELGTTATPYPHSEDPSSKVIEQTADHNPENTLKIFFDQTDGSQIAKVKSMRAAMTSTIDDFRKWLEQNEASGSKYYHAAVDKSYSHLVEAKMWLGFELAGIKQLGK